MFDEGIFEDINYRVDVSSCMFILTSNFNNEETIASTVGLPIFSRSDQKIKFEKLTKDEISIVISSAFKRIMSELTPTDQTFIRNSELEDHYQENLQIFSNIRMLDSFIENDVYTMLLERQITINSSSDE